MKLILNNNFSQPARNIIQRCGYHEFRDPRTREVSYSRRLGSLHYPRFHLYVAKDEPGKIELDLHIDQKQASYEGYTRHSGEYEGKTISGEMERVRRVFLSFVINKNV